MTAFANAKDSDEVRQYLIADYDEEIDSHCKEKNYTIISRPAYVDPSMVCHHFKWVSNRPRPAIWNISKPYPKK
mgnify:CR=1 FL=1|jgi:hypothetical protein|tara:strand:- start:2002 stop:2223 length:222 start_codon:yes stop_codon:yes gene_type:complete